MPLGTLKATGIKAAVDLGRTRTKDIGRTRRRDFHDGRRGARHGDLRTTTSARPGNWACSPRPWKLAQKIGDSLSSRLASSLADAMIWWVYKQLRWMRCPVWAAATVAGDLTS